MISNNIFTILKEKGISQKELAAALQISEKTVSSWNAGRSSYNKYLPQIAEFLGVSVDRLTGAENTEKDAGRRKDLDRIHKLTDADLKRIIAMGELSGIIPKETEQ